MDSDKIYLSLNRIMSLMYSYNINNNEINNIKYIIYNIMVSTKINSLHCIMNDLNINDIDDKKDNEFILNESYNIIRNTINNNNLSNDNMKYLEKIYNLLIKLIKNS